MRFLFIESLLRDNTYVKLGDINYEMAQKNIVHDIMLLLSDSKEQFARDARSDHGLAFKFDVTDAV